MDNYQNMGEISRVASAHIPLETQNQEEVSADQIVPTLLRVQERIAQIENFLRQIGDISELYGRLEQVEGHLFASKEILTVKEAKEFLGISESQLYKLTRTLSIPHYKPSGKTIFFSRQEIVDWVKERPARRKNIASTNTDIVSMNQNSNGEEASNMIMAGKKTNET